MVRFNELGVPLHHNVVVRSVSLLEPSAINGQRYVARFVSIDNGAVKGRPAIDANHVRGQFRDRQSRLLGDDRLRLNLQQGDGQ